MASDQAQWDSPSETLMCRSVQGRFSLTFPGDGLGLAGPLLKLTGTTRLQALSPLRQGRNGVFAWLQIVSGSFGFAASFSTFILSDGPSRLSQSDAAL